MAKPLRFYLAQWTGKAVYSVMKLLGRNATHFPGMLALKIDPQYLKHVGKPETIVCITGTNGKTTTANMIGDQVALAEKTYMHNRFGSNTMDGIVSSFIGFTTVGGACPYELGVLEIDERSALRIFAQMTPDYLVVTNLFRDSYARNAHADYIFAILNEAVPDGTTMVLNYDDLISSALKPDNPRVGISLPLLEGEIEDRNSRIKDLVNCPVCHHELTPDFIRYNHIGRYHCENCGFKSPEPDFRVTTADLNLRRATISHVAKAAEQAAGHVDSADTVVETAEFTLSTNNIVDLYNLLSATALLSQLGISLEQQAARSAKVAVVASRYADVTVGGKRVLTVLAKACNPIASSRTFDFVRKEPGTKCVILANSELKKGNHNLENIAWIYDNDFSYLNDSDIKQIICCGKRYLDFAFCLALAGVPEEKIKLEEDFARVPAAVNLAEVDTVCVLKDLDTETISREMSAKIQKRILEAS